MRARTKQRRFRILLLIILIAVVFLAWKQRADDAPAPTSSDRAPSSQTQENSTPSVPLVDLQPTLDAWLKNNAGTYSVVVRDLENDKITASVNQEDEYFMASLYKLYVAYLAYIDVQNGVHRLDEPFLNSWNRGKCLDEMIRTSHSPCGEKYMAELDRQVIEDRLKNDFDFKCTDYGSFITCAHDADLILRRLHQRKDLNDTHTKALLDSMKGNIYRDAIVKGAGDATVYDKVGFRELVEYHDVAIIQTPDGRHYVLSVLTQNAHARRIADLTKTLLEAL